MRLSSQAPGAAQRLHRLRENSGEGGPGRNVERGRAPEWGETASW
jgi:hypothetical protein